MTLFIYIIDLNTLHYHAYFTNMTFIGCYICCAFHLFTLIAEMWSTCGEHVRINQRAEREASTLSL